MQADGFLIAFVQEVEGGVMVGWLATPLRKLLQNLNTVR